MVAEKFFQRIDQARRLLELPEQATLEEIKANYHRLLTRWHPDHNQGSSDECLEMTRKIIAAYNILLAYCEQYRYSFSQKAVQSHLTAEEWWLERFGEDPLWGKVQHKSG